MMTSTSKSPIAKVPPSQPRTSNTSILQDLTSGAKGTVLRAWNAYKSYRTFQAAKAQLMALDGHTLKDIGIDRSEIESVLTDHAQERRTGVHSPSVPAANSALNPSEHETISPLPLGKRRVATIDHPVDSALAA